MTIIDDLVSGWLETYAVLSKASRRSALAIGIGLSLLPVFNAGVLAVVLPGSWYLPLSQEDKDKGKTELMHASSFGDVERVRELLAKGENPNQTDGDGWAALHYTCLGGEASGWPKEMSRLEVMKLLVAAGAGVNAVAGNDTALSMSARKGQVEWVRFLLASGADPNIPGAMGPNIPAVAGTGHTDDEAAQIIVLLARAGAELYATNFRGETAMQVARLEKRPPVIRALATLEKERRRRPK
jgi:ankyrin repeat protein